MRWVGIQRMANRLRANRNWVLVALLVSTFGFPASATAAGSSWWWFFGDDLAPVFYSVTPSAGAEVANSYVIVEFDVYDPWRIGLRTSRLDGGSIQVSQWPAL